MAEQIYTQEHFDRIWDEMAKGRSLKSICNDEGMPTERTVMRRVAADDVLCQQYARAMEQRADAIFDGMLDIADNTEKDMITLEDGREIVDHNVIGRDKLRIDTRKWILSRMNPKKYGDSSKVDVTSGGDKITWNEVRTYDKPESE
jgi:SHS2 domain-containing protein